MYGIELSHRSAFIETHTFGEKAAWRRASVVIVYVAVFWIALPALLWAIGARLDAWLALPLPTPIARAIGLVVASLGAVPLIEAMWLLWSRGRGLPISHLPPTRIVTTGLYASVRHPIYLGFTLAWSGLALALGSWGAALGAGSLLTLAWIAYVRAFEEPQLYARFAETYASYAARTALLVRPPPVLVRLAFALWTALAPAMERLANRTVAWRTRSVSLVTYGLFVGAGAFAMTLWSGAQFVALGVPAARFAPFAVAVGGAMLLGGRIAGILYRAPLLFTAPVQALRTVGFVSWGGYLGMFVVAYAGASWLGLAPEAVADRLVLAGLLCSAIGRFGCLSYGCCGGAPWRHGIVWRNPEARIVRELGPSASVPRIPTQILSSLLALALSVVLAALTPRPLPAGAVAALGVLAYGLGRAALEATREEARFGHLCLTRGQLVTCAAAAIATIALLVIDGPASWPRPAWEAPLAAWCAALPAAFGCGALTLVVTGLHGPRVGRW